MTTLLLILRWSFLGLGWLVFTSMATGVLIAVWMIYSPVREFAEEAALQDIMPKCGPPKI